MHGLPVRAKETTALPMTASLPPKYTLTADGAAVSCKYGFGPDAAAVECSGSIVVADPPRADQPLANAELVRGKLVLMQRGERDAEYVPVGERVQRLHVAGAAAVVLANPGENEGLAGAGSIAVVSVSASDGERLVSAANVMLMVVQR